jgi:hypothetical protein
VLAPLATLAGSFDPSLNPRLQLPFWANQSGTMITVVPKSGDTVIAVIRPWNGKDHITRHACPFMPDKNGASLVVIKDLADPKVLEVLKKIQAARTKPVTRPSKLTE